MIKSFYILMVSLIVRQPELQPNKFSGRENEENPWKREQMGDGNEKEREVLGA